jgi:ATP/maltotriose-dependent transcriptional regulator MalT
LYGLGQVLAAHGDLAAARKRHEGALALRDQIGEEGTAAESRLALAELSIDQGRLAEAQTLVQQAADEFRKERETEFEAAAYAIGARSLLAAGKSSEAASTIIRAEQLLRGTEDREARLLVGIDGARVQAAQGNTAQAIAELQPIVGEAKKYGYLGYELAARLAVVETEMKSGGSSEARRKLVSLAAEAQAKGFGLIAGKAGVALRH